ncbi:MAG: MBL fold metallo-hydrolase [Chloroflexota bacterium]
MIVRKLVVGPLATNCYLVGAEATKAGMIIDPGGSAGEILDAVKYLGLQIGLIVLTHGHIDHIGALEDVRKATGAEVAIHQDDAFYLEERSVSAVFGLPYPDCSPPDRLLKDKDRIDIDELSFEVLHTGGHSPGGICLLGNGALFSGDTLFNYGIGRSDFPGGNGRLLLENIRSRLMPLPDSTVVYTGHGPDTTIGAEREGNPFLRL